MAANFNTYVAISYAVPFGIFALLFGIISIVNKRAHSFIVGNVLGITLKPDEIKSKDSQQKYLDSESNKNTTIPIPWQERSDNVTKMSPLEKRFDKFLYVDEDESQQTKPLPCIVRFFCDLFSSAILTLLLEIIFGKCVLATTAVVVGDPCPDFSADCFGTHNGIRNYGPFQCINGQNATFLVTSTRLDCYGWVYKDMTTDKVLDAIGISGGLLGLVSCIVPLVYYVSHCKKRCWWMSICCIVLPLMTIAVFILLIVCVLPNVVGGYGLSMHHTQRPYVIVLNHVVSKNVVTLRVDI